MKKVKQANKQNSAITFRASKVIFIILSIALVGFFALAVAVDGYESGKKKISIDEQILCVKESNIEEWQKKYEDNYYYISYNSVENIEKKTIAGKRLYNSFNES